MYSEQRQMEIAKLIEKEDSVDVGRLAALFGISKETIRKDLTELERQGILKRTHGGAVLESTNREFPIVIRGAQQVEEKKDICKKAASFIQEGDILFVDNSSTLLYLPQYLNPHMNLTILTNSLNFLLEAAKEPNRSWLLICLGGILNPRNHSVYGSGTMKSCEEYYPSKAFFSCAGISAESNVADSSLHEIEAKKMMIARAQKTFLLADHSKLNKAGQIFLCDFEDVDYIISDFGAIDSDIAYLKEKNIKLIAT